MVPSRALLGDADIKDCRPDSGDSMDPSRHGPFAVGHVFRDWVDRFGGLVSGDNVDCIRDL
jgi:hypothetical protein